MTEARLDEVVDQWFGCGKPARDWGEDTRAECMVCRRMVRFALETCSITVCGDCIVASRKRRKILC